MQMTSSCHLSWWCFKSVAVNWMDVCTNGWMKILKVFVDYTKYPYFCHLSYWCSNGQTEKVFFCGMMDCRHKCPYTCHLFKQVFLNVNSCFKCMICTQQWSDRLGFFCELMDFWHECPCSCHLPDWYFLMVMAVFTVWFVHSNDEIRWKGCDGRQAGAVIFMEGRFFTTWYGSQW